MSRSCKVKCKLSQHSPGVLCENNTMSNVAVMVKHLKMKLTTESKLAQTGTTGKSRQAGGTWIQEQQWSSGHSFCPLGSHQGAAKCFESFGQKQHKAFLHVRLQPFTQTPVYGGGGSGVGNWSDSLCALSHIKQDQHKLLSVHEHIAAQLEPDAFCKASCEHKR